MMPTSSAGSPSTVVKRNLVSNLPNELLLQISDSIPSNYDEQCHAFSSIARVCRHFHLLITPMLYRSFEDCCAKHLQFFSKTIFTRQDRAVLVKHFKGRQPRNLYNTKRAGCNEYSGFAGTPDQALVMTARKQVSSSSGQMKSFRFIAYSLSCICPNIQCLDVADGSQYLLERLYALALSFVLRPPNSFQHLHTLSISIDPDRRFELQIISLLFNMPSLRALTINRASLTVQEEQVFAHKSVHDVWLCNWRTSAIEELTFEECSLPIEWITEAVMSCKILTHFHLEYFHWLVSKDLHLRLFGSLAKHADSLQYLRINELHGCKMYSRNQLELYEPISLAAYRSLTHVDMPLFLLLTKTRSRMIQDIFPSTLQVLTFDVRSTREGFSDAFFISLAEATRNHIPSLKCVEIICRIEEYKRNGYVPLHFCHLRRMFSSRGIELVYFLEFVSCEFEAVYMKSFLNTLKRSGPDGHELADHSSL